MVPLVIHDVLWGLNGCIKLDFVLRMEGGTQDYCSGDTDAELLPIDF